MGHQIMSNLFSNSWPCSYTECMSVLITKKIRVITAKCAVTVHVCMLHVCVCVCMCLCTSICMCMHLLKKPVCVHVPG